MRLPKRILDDIDPEIRPLTIDLNKRGFETRECCAGHDYSYTVGKVTKKGTEPGYIAFYDGTFDFGKIGKILRDFGLKDLELIPANRHDYAFRMVYFRPMGETHHFLAEEEKVAQGSTRSRIIGRTSFPRKG